MNPPDEFLKHAADCEQMAKFARDAESKATWKRMAERWHRGAEKFTSESLAAHQAMAAKVVEGSKSPHRFPEKADKSLAHLRGSCFQAHLVRLRNQIAVIPMPHSRIFRSESHFRAH
jgi:hypothetical protein